MATSLGLHGAAHQGSSRASSVRSLREALIEAMHRTGWTQEALGAHYKRDRSYVQKRLKDPTQSMDARPLSARDIDALPTDLRQMLARVMAEDAGMHVVESLHVELANQIAAQLAARRL